MKKSGSSEEIANAIKSARVLSDLIIAHDAKTEISRKNFRMIAAIGEMLITTRPPTEPSYDNILERGNVLYAEFPARQTLKNYYRSMVGAWRGAYYQVIHLLANELLQKAMGDKVPKGLGTDAGVTIAVLREKVVRLQAELDDHRHATSKMIPQEGSSSLFKAVTEGIDGQVINFAPVRKWLAQLNDPDSLFVEETAGLRLAPSARPGRLVIDRKVLEALRVL